ncbi:phage portal protein [Calidithermus chliarophilus]|uniref:phage portal protein n=1 Tax=Calidithermus chliarophilus TaxID=52023 RepID=UPI00047F7FDD|nr:phage portal protein [Calidithermus chliarophilus]
MSDVDPQALKAARTAMQPDAPPDERQDAALEVARGVKGAVPVFSKADLFKAAAYGYAVAQRRAGQAKSDTADPFRIFRPSPVLSGRPAPLGFAQLRSLATHDVILASIVLTRQRQVASLAQAAQMDRDPGFRVKLRGLKDSEMTDGARQRIEWLTRYVENCGAEFSPFARKKLKRDDFSTFLKKAVMDTLLMDAMPVEIVRTHSGRPHGFKSVDGATVYVAPPEGFEDTLPEPVAATYELPDLGDVDGIMVVDSQVQHWFRYDELLYPLRNPRTDLYGAGYGLAETELMLRVMTGLVNVLSYNQKAYSENHVPQGFLTVFGDFSDEDVEVFKNEWASYVAGVSNAFRLPVLVSKDKESGAVFTKTGVEVTEMAFVKLITLYIAIEAALYGIDPNEIGFESFTSKSSSLSDGSVESRLAASQDKGLRPLLQHLQSPLQAILEDVDPDAVFTWTGFQDPKEAAEFDKLVLTFGEARERAGLPLTGDAMLDNAPLNPAMQSVYLQAQGMAQMGTEAGGEGEGEEGWPPQEGEEGEGGQHQGQDRQEADGGDEGADGGEEGAQPQNLVAQLIRRFGKGKVRGGAGGGA